MDAVRAREELDTITIPKLRSKVTSSIWLENIKETYHHSKGAIHRKVCQSTTKHSILIVITSPHQIWNGHDETLHESDWKSVRVHEHGSCDNEAPVASIRENKKREWNETNLWDGRSLNSDPKTLPTTMEVAVTIMNQMGMTHNSFSFSRKNNSWQESQWDEGQNTDLVSRKMQLWRTKGRVWIGIHLACSFAKNMFRSQ